MKSQEEQWLLKEKYKGEKSEAFFADCKALALGTPLGYLIRNVPFLDCTIHLDNRPLIPRVETEFWVERAIEVIKESQNIQPSLSAEPADLNLAQPRLCKGGFGWGMQGATESGSGRPVHATRILDLCAGSGCIGVAVAHTVPTARVDFGELNKELIPTIEKNIGQNVSNPERCRVYHSNLFTQLPPEIKYDFILSNPPYINPAIDRATESVKTHEPHLALYGGTDGVEVIEQLIAAAANHLTASGQLWIEHEPEQATIIQKIAHEHNFATTNHLDQYGVNRYSILVYDLNCKESEARL